MSVLQPLSHIMTSDINTLRIIVRQPDCKDSQFAEELCFTVSRSVYTCVIHMRLIISEINLQSINQSIFNLSIFMEIDRNLSLINAIKRQH